MALATRLSWDGRIWGRTATTPVFVRFPRRSVRLLLAAEAGEPTAAVRVLVDLRGEALLDVPGLRALRALREMFEPFDATDLRREEGRPVDEVDFRGVIFSLFCYP